MIGRNLRYLVTLAACALLPLAGCSGGSTSPTKVTEKGTEVTVSGNVATTAAKSAAKTAIAVNTVEVTNAQDGALLGSATVAANGSFTGLTFTLPAAKTVLVFKATVAQGTFLSVVPIDLSNPPAAGAITGASPISVVISQESTATAVVVSQLLGLSGDLGDAGMTLNSVSKTYADAATLVVDNGGQQLAYGATGLALTGKFSSEALLPAIEASTLDASALKNTLLDGSITSVSIPGSKPIVSFQVTNKATGKGIKGLKSFNLVIAQLKPGTNGGSNQWQSYMTTGTSRPSTDSGYSVIDNGDGSYTVIFGKDIKAGTGGTVVYDANLTHRLMVGVRSSSAVALQEDGSNLSNFYNEKYFVTDFVPATPGVTPTEQRTITTTDACNACHTKIGVTTPHGGRGDVKYCAMCHTSQRANGRTPSTSSAGVFTGSTYVADGEVSGEFVTMIHKIHMGSKLTKTGYNYAGIEFNHIEYPVWNSVANCRTCHQDGAAPQGDNWQTKPTRKSCGSCHDNIDFATGANIKSGGTAHVPQADDSFCVGCHGTAGPYPVEKFHRTKNATTNNPVAQAGYHKIEYEISSVTVNETNQPVVTFRILKDGVPATFNAYTGTTTAEATAFAASGLLTGFKGSPSFLVVYADGTQSTVDFNNLGRSGGQPLAVSIATVANGVNGTLAAGTDGYYVATLNATFPAGAKLRTIALQGYFTQLSGTNGISADAGRYAISVTKSVAGEERREVVDSAKCAKCHEYILAHGSNRVYNAQVCVTCHNPNLSSSGKTVNLAYAEATQNFRDMIHSIHAGAFRTTDYVHYRAKSATSATEYNWNFVKFPGILSDCLMCHKPGTYGSVPAGALLTTDITTDGTNATLAAVTAARASLPNGTDLVTTPFSATCVGCHDGSSAKAHMSSNGGSILIQRSSANTAEGCAVCHAPGRSAAFHTNIR